MQRFLIIRFGISFAVRFIIRFVISFIIKFTIGFVIRFSTSFVIKFNIKFVYFRRTTCFRLVKPGSGRGICAYVLVFLGYQNYNIEVI